MISRWTPRYECRWLAAGIMLILLPTTAMMRGESVKFNREILPILSANCFQCHGPDPKNRKGKLRLDVREEALAKKAFVPGKPEESELLKRLDSTDPEEHMPPPDTHKVLGQSQKNILKQWISEGAKYELHWSYTPVVRPPLPQAKEPKWAANPVDRFILQRLESLAIRPSPSANRATLLRRLSLDLTGLPPTPAEVAAFEKDKSSRAYEKQVDRLLSSLHFGERMAVPWLDAVRFADTVGYHGDQNQNVFPYRDYVIDSFNQNKPFNQFTIEQIAGDLLPNATPEQKTASGFNRLNMMTREGGAQPKEYLAKYAADRVRTVSTVWLGSTMACCECHDHKYDPFLTRDFYSMAAFFDDVQQWGVYNDYAYTPNPDLKGFDNDYPFPPELMVPNAYIARRDSLLHEKWAKTLLDSLSRLEKDKQTMDSFEQWKEQSKHFLERFPDGWEVALHPSVKLSGSPTNASLSVLDRGQLLVEGTGGAEKPEIQFELSPGRISAIRLEALPHPSHNASGLRTNVSIGKIGLSAVIKHQHGEEIKIEFHDSHATARMPVYANGQEIFDLSGNWKLPASAARNPQHAVYLLKDPIHAEPGDLMRITLSSQDLGCFRISTTPFAASDALKSGATAELAVALARPSRLQSTSDRQCLLESYFFSEAADVSSLAELRQIKRSIRECRNGTSPTLVTVSTNKLLVTRVLPRGNWQDESGEVLLPATPTFLPSEKHTGTNRITRLDLGRWLVSPENPLTARAFVNRLWKQTFGNGLSNQPEELGAQGEPPSHPELIDWLAAELIDSRWNVKHMVKLLVMSSTYQQDSRGRLELQEIDPANRLLARQNPRRLDAEFVRDNALVIAGLLDPEIGGPSAFPYQPSGYYANIQFPDRDYFASKNENQYRRGLYAHRQRTFLQPMLANFDAPAREECTVDRAVSNTPQQALTLLNDPSFVEAARVFAERILSSQETKTDQKRLDQAFRIALMRPAKAGEAESMLKLLDTQRRYYSENRGEADKLRTVGFHSTSPGLDAAEVAAWTGLTRVILNLHETITRY